MTITSKGITPLQIFLHKDEGHWLNGKPDAEDRESFQVGGRWFKPNLREEIATHEETIEQLQAKIGTMQNEYRQTMMNKDNEHRKALEAKKAKHNEVVNFLNSLYMKARRWFPDLADLLKIEKEYSEIGISSSNFSTLLDYKEHKIQSDKEQVCRNFSNFAFGKL